jgi:hypothetical protein
MMIKWDIKQHTIHYNQMTKVIFGLSQAIDGLDSFGAKPATPWSHIKCASHFTIET